MADVFVVGTSHAVASASVRERLHVPLDEVHAALAPLLQDGGGLLEAVPLSTCARLEIYGIAADASAVVDRLVGLLAERVSVAACDMKDHVYVLRGPAAVLHLFRVAAGLDSVVHGEAQILGQVRDAAHHPLAVDRKGPILHRLFELSLAAGKRVRTETEIGRGGASLAAAAIEMVRSEIGSLEGVSALVLGAGDTGSLVARLLRKAGVRRLVVANRTVDTARRVAEGLGGEGVGLDDLGAHIAEADLVVGAATAGELLVTPSTLAAAGGSVHRSRHFLDLAHPRNFDPALADVPGVRLHDLDRVFARVEAVQATRVEQIARAEAIVREQAEGFEGWVRSRRSVALVRAVREHVLAVAQAEAEQFAQGRVDAERERLARFARSLARTLLHPATVTLREIDPASPEGRLLLESAPTLFGLAGAQKGDLEPPGA